MAARVSLCTEKKNVLRDKIVRRKLMELFVREDLFLKNSIRRMW
ncbi:hypothetical protein Cs308_0100 [Candidatus Chlamydia sanziniae]|uniref:Uncharacterized protein n=1 Tax=Candidatus Chlamydia sanziniae TaxID=1806891 RepID=A0A1A9HV45_9CHLA|nr:hypothetical protein Cs308_0100 [Candidatus Chlamydia sanziniae]